MRSSNVNLDGFFSKGTKHNFFIRGAGLTVFLVPDVSLFWAYVANVILDSTDCRFRIDGTKCIGDVNYQLEDKVMDLLMDLVALHTALKEERDFNNVLIFTYMFRLVGCILFLITKDDSILFFFPNLFSIFFLFFFFLEEYDLEFDNNTFWILIAMIIGKMIQEYILHIKKIHIIIN